MSQVDLELRNFPTFVSAFSFYLSDKLVHSIVASVPLDLRNILYNSYCILIFYIVEKSYIFNPMFSMFFATALRALLKATAFYHFAETDTLSPGLTLSLIIKELLTLAERTFLEGGM